MDEQEKNVSYYGSVSQGDTSEGKRSHSASPSELIEVKVNEHEHGPNCGHVAVHHTKADGSSHLAFINNDATTDCFEVSAVTDGCCNMKVNKVRACSFKSIIGPEAVSKDSSDAESCEHDEEVASGTGQSIILDKDHGKLKVLTNDGAFYVLQAMNEAELVHHSKCDPTKDVCCDSDLCGRRLTNHDGVVPSVCTGTWENLFHSAGCDLSAPSKHSVFPVERKLMKAQKEKSRFADTLVAINDMCCSMEAKLARDCLDKLPGVKSLSVNVPLRRITVTHDPEILRAKKIIEILKKQSLEPVLISTQEDTVQISETKNQTSNPAEDPTSDGKAEVDWKVGFAVFFLLLSFVQYGENSKAPWLEYFKYSALISVALCLPGVLLKSIKRLRRYTLDITTLMSLASIGAVALGEYAEAAAVITLYSLSGVLEAIATTRIRTAVQDLVKLKPKHARRVFNENGSAKVSVVSAESIAVGDVLEVRVGDIISNDGTVIFGTTLVDESALTGEPKPVSKSQEKNSSVFSGTVNLGPGLLHVSVTAASNESVVSKMLKLVEEATANKSQTEQFVESVARIYTPVIFICAILMATVPWVFGIDAGKKYAKFALVLLVIGCPCALVISTPITYIAGLAQAAKKGILIKGGTYLETLAKVKVICLDKTGTLTKGKFELSKVIINEKRLFFGNDEQCPCEEDGEISTRDLQLVKTKNDVYEIVNLVEAGSNHPIALSLCKALEQKVKKNAEQIVEIDGHNFKRSDVKLNHLETIKGKGVSAVVYRVFSTEVMDGSEGGCEDLCCVKEQRDIFYFPEDETQDVDLLEKSEKCEKGCCSSTKKSNPFEANNDDENEILFKYLIGIVDKGVTAEDIDGVKTALPKEVLKATLMTGNECVLVSNVFVEFKKMQKSFEIFGIDIVMQKIKVSQKVFVGNQRLTKDLDWLRFSFLKNCQVHAKEDQHLFTQVEFYERQGFSSCIFGTRSKAFAAFFVGDTIREETKELIHDLRNLDVTPVVLTGDNEYSARIVCDAVNITDCYAGLLPEEKQQNLNSFKYKQEDEDNGQRSMLKPKQTRQIVAMVGDGINDALSLAAADVSISLGQSGTSLAVETADVTLIEDNLAKITEAIKLGKLAVSKITQNVVFSVVVKILVAGITFGVPYPNLWLAILSDVGAMLIVTLNSISIISVRTKKQEVMKECDIERGHSHSSSQGHSHSQYQEKSLGHSHSGKEHGHSHSKGNNHVHSDNEKNEKSHESVHSNGDKAHGHSHGGKDCIGHFKA